jgi:hypothetical protein
MSGFSDMGFRARNRGVFFLRVTDALFCKFLLIWGSILVRLGRVIRTVRHLIGHMLDPLFLGLPNMS